jgi:hypothetical protein
MRDSVTKGMPNAATSQRGQHRPSPIYREYFADLLPFDGRAARIDGPPLPVTAGPPAGTGDAKA